MFETDFPHSTALSLDRQVQPDRLARSSRRTLKCLIALVMEKVFSTNARELYRIG
jgi:hypothetical protein